MKKMTNNSQSPKKSKLGLITTLVLGLTFLLGFGARALMLGSVPTGALVDEAHFGYLAWSILETGQDEHSQSYPIVFKGFGDQKLPGQVYSLVPVIHFMGLNNFSIRVPSLIAGSFLILAVYWLMVSLKFKRGLALAAAVITTTLPWTFLLSRFGLEANSGLLLFTLGLAAGFAWLRKGRLLYALLTGLLLGLTWYWYIAFRPVSAVMVGAFLAMAFGHVVIGLGWWRAKRQSLARLLSEDKGLRAKIRRQNYLLGTVALAGVFIAMIIPFLLPGTSQSNQARLKQIGLFHDPVIASIVMENRTFCTQRAPKVLCYATWNKGTVLGNELVRRWLAVYSPQFLATTGADNDYLRVEDFGQLYVCLYFVLLLGLAILAYRVVKREPGWGTASLILLGLIVAPLPAIIAGPPQPVRLTPLIPFILIAITYGLDWLWQLLPSRNNWRWLVLALVSLIFLLGFGRFLLTFIGLHTLKYETAYDSHLPALFEFLETLPAETKIVMNPISSDPIMYYAYYTQLHPSDYQEQVELSELEESGFQHARALANLEVSEDLIDEVGCELVADNRNGVYVSRNKLARPILYQAQTSNKVHTLIYVYDATTGLTPRDCGVNAF